MIYSKEKKQILSDMVQRYTTAPSIAFCRVPEVYYLSQIDISGKNVLDHCCGDGFISQYTFNGVQISAGIDLNPGSIALAEQKGIYNKLSACDASKQLPFADETFDIIYNNSALEHIPDLSSTLKETYRITKKDGTFHFCVLGANFYHKYWPLSSKALKDYCDFQPIFHILSKTEWVKQFENAGFHMQSVKYYFNDKESTYLAWLDYKYSAFYLSRKRDLGVFCNLLLSKVNQNYVSKHWLKKLSGFSFDTDSLDENNSSGLYLVAVKR